MMNCTYRLSLEELLTMPKGLLALRGADGKDDPAEPDPKPKEDEDDESKSGDDDDDDKDKGDDKKPDAKDRRIAGLEEEKDRHARLRQEAVDELKNVKAELSKLKKDGTPDDALKNENDTLTATNTTLTEANRSLMLENALLKEVGFDWVDPEAVLRLADLSKVEFDEKTNKAVGLNGVLTKLAKDKPYLLKAKAEDDDDADDQKPRSTGRAPKAGKQTDAAKKAAEAKLRAKYPALRR